MKTSIALLSLILLTSCAKQPIRRVSHQLTIPCTNQYAVAGETLVRSNLDARRSRSAERPPDALLEYSTDGTTYKPFPMVVYSTTSNTMGIREITVRDTDLWIRITTTNSSDIGRAVVMGFTVKDR